MEISSRRSTNCRIFGSFDELSERKLPTYKNVMKYYNLVRYRVKVTNSSKKEPTINEISEIVTQKVESLWFKASIPIISHTRVMQLYKTYHAKCTNLIKSWNRLSEDKKQDFLLSFEKILDLSACKCKNFQLCSCPKEKKCPIAEQTFLTDQRTNRKMVMDGIDLTATRKNMKSIERKQKLNTYYSTTKTPLIDTSRESPNNSKDSESDQDVTSPVVYYWEV